MGFHFSTKIFHFRRNLPFQNLLIISPAKLISSFSTFSAENPFYAKTFSHIFQECSKNKANEAGRQAHARMIVSGFKPTVIVANCLLQMYIKCSRLECAAKVFDRMPQRNCVSWNTMIFGYSVNGKMGSSQSLFELMPLRDVISWNSLISGYLQNGSCARAIEVFVIEQFECLLCTPSFARVINHCSISYCVRCAEFLIRQFFQQWTCVVDLSNQHQPFDESVEGHNIRLVAALENTT